MVSPGSNDDDDDDGRASAAAAAVCCMCGDHGLPRELYRCDLCRIRTQHRYEYDPPSIYTPIDMKRETATS